MIDREKVNAILRKRFPGTPPRELAAAVNAIVGLGSAEARDREEPMMTVANVLVALDFGDASMNALAYGRELARQFHATLHVLHVVDDMRARMVTAAGLPYDFGHMQDDLDEVERRRLNDAVTEDDRRELNARPVQITSANPAREIVAYAAGQHMDLIVMGTHGRGPVAHLLMGSVAERVVRTAPCPVLTVRHPEREFIRPDALQVAPEKTLPA